MNVDQLKIPELSLRYLKNNPNIGGIVNCSNLIELELDGFNNLESLDILINLLV